MDIDDKVTSLFKNFEILSVQATSYPVIAIVNPEEEKRKTFLKCLVLPSP